MSSRDKWKEAQRTAAGAQSRLYAGIVDIDDKQIVAEKEIAERERGWFSRMSKRYKEYFFFFIWLRYKDFFFFLTPSHPAPA